MPTVTDNCDANPSLSETGPRTGCPWPVGDTVVTWTSKDKFGNTTVAYQTVTVIQDSQAPTVTCPGNQTLPVDGSCQATLPNYTSMATVSDNSDQCANCSGPTVTQLPAPGGSYSGAGTVIPVTLTATDAFSNSASCTFNATLVDNTPPSVTCKDKTVYLNATGDASITPNDVYSSGSDNCGTVNLVSVTPNAFTCANRGANTVTLTVNDGNGNTATCTATVTVVDNIDPIARCKDIAINLDASGQASITATDVDDGSTDNCGIILKSVSPDVFTCANLGPNTVMLTVEDASGNTDTCNSTVTVVDDTPPVPDPDDVSTREDVAIVIDVLDGDTDNCGGVILKSASNPVHGSAVILGAQVLYTPEPNWSGTDTFIYTIADPSGNEALGTATVTVRAENDPPVAEFGVYTT
ncbi:MAG: HYR domain-containing protein, partial [Dehalococcoidia bacterium]|nr:HYR domain-containing protein [Dehalococcoidia bacterium]